MVETLLQYIPMDYSSISDILGGTVYYDNYLIYSEIIKLILDDGKLNLGDNIFEQIDLGFTEFNLEMAKIILTDVRAHTSKANLDQVVHEVNSLIIEDLLKYPTVEIRSVDFPLDQEINKLNLEIDKLMHLSHIERNDIFRSGYDVVIENLLLQIDELDRKKIFYHPVR